MDANLLCRSAMALLLGYKLLSLFLLSLFLVSPSLSDPLFQVCGKSGNYTANSTYESNLLALLPSMASNGSDHGFYSDTVGRVPSQVFALSFCRGDINATVCRSCLDLARQDVLQLCGYSSGATIWYDYCTFRYSNQNFLSTTDNSDVVLMMNTQNVTDPDKFNKLAAELVNRTSQYAAFNSFERFGTGEANFTATDPNIYGLAQCTRDLSGDQCYKCLTGITSAMSRFLGKRGGRVLGSRCYFRYELYSFYEGESMVQLPSSSSSPPLLLSPMAPSQSNGTNTTGNGNITSAVPIVGGDGISVPTATIVLLIVLPVIGFVLLLSTIYLYFQRRRTAKKMVFFPEIEDETVFESGESRLFDLNDLKEATDNFSDANMLGEGGFGPVYKGALKDGQEIAVKRLSRTSGQGMLELRNEVAFVAKLQHRNLVRLLGCCLEDKEKLLVYEYLPNTSLDKFLFDPIKCQQLDWSKRYKIIQGISKGLLYLHEDSRLRIIHRDLKASNILLDGDMNPKISDFGLAKHFGVNETHGNTCRIAGTYGYMAPEYAFRGEFSTKSDVFSYGVLVLEIVTGRKNTRLQRSRPAASLLNHVWQHWSEGRALELRDHVLDNNFIEEQMSRCIHIGLLCVQEDPIKRPKMASVVHMLSVYSIPLPTPCSPAFLNFSSMFNESDGSRRRICVIIA
ncbi:hypothetical protein J5N97_011511 [Dioscorea zingiberensis]|uniref:non-specific serine/threonine protein kinase n=1 Tax=Dioscorea zingiberensis TaxID=325984 RepID=A0A9D5D0R6_9LILI|nr:hypothetical protein J5N97_011511 [Dioscorea zingiberensis]